jgi:hypothetical protein
MKQTALLFCLLMSASGMASAQAPPAPATPPAQTAPPAPVRTSDCAPMPSRGAVWPEGTTTGQRAEPLGDRLAKSNGVLCPPAGVDPEMRAPAPDVGNTPVVRPPGGDPNLRPK